MSAAELAPARGARRRRSRDHSRSSARYLARVLDDGPAPGDRVFLPLERLIYRAAGVDPAREQPWSVYALSLLAFSAVSALGLFALQRLQGFLPLNPTDVDSVPPAARLQHRRQLHHQHELAELRRRVDDEPSHPDGRADRAELRLGRRRDRRRRRAHPRPHATAVARRSATSGSTSRASTIRVLVPLSLVDRAAARRARAWSRASAAARRRGPSRARRRRSTAAPSRARRRSRSSARTAAASSTPTPRTRSRTRPRFTNLSRSGAAR